MAVTCLAALIGIVPREAAYIVLAVVFGGLLAGRLASLGLDGSMAGYTQTVVALYAIDTLGCALAGTALVLDRGNL